MDKRCLIAFVILCSPACQTDTSSELHAHEEVEATQITLWNQEVELFIEHPPFVAGQPTRFVTHVTHLDRWSPRTTGEIHLILSTAGQAPIEIHDKAPARDGIYIPTLTFPKAGRWKIEVRVPLNDTTISTQVISDVAVYSSEHDAMHHASEAEEGGISFLKEQQWQMPFASDEVVERPFRESLIANGTLTPRAGGEVMIHAPVAGRLLAAESAFAHLGILVEKGQRLASLIPRLDQADDPASLTLAVRRAELAYDFAQTEFVRIKQLFEKEAVPENRLRRAELDVKATHADLTTAQARFRQVSALQKESGSLAKTRVDLYSPLSGTVIEANVVPGALVAEGDRMFQIIDLATVWLNIQIPAGDIGRMRHASGAWFTVEGMDQIFEVNPQTGSRMIALGGKIDPQRRTVPLIFELPNPEGLLKIGMFARVSVLTGKTATGPSVPLSALVEEAGRSVAYIQVSGESFERRFLKLGLRDGNRVQILSGLAVGERVVTTGAYQIRLAAASTTLPAHGHGH